MVNAANNNSRGVLVSPTGSGKTLTQAEIVAQEILKGGFRVIMIKTPRILLSNQVSAEYNNYFYNNHDLSRGVDYNSILVHSGKNPLERADSEDDESEMDLEEWAEIAAQLSEAYTDRSSIEAFVKEAKKNNVPFIIFTTYHSNIKAVECIGDNEVALDVNDEGHYLVREDFASVLDAYTPARQYFFTATLRVTVSDEGRGMNNTDSFGDCIYKMPIRDAIAKDLILPIKPRLIKSQSEISFDDEHKGIGEIVDHCFDDLLEQSDLEAPSLLIATNGGDQIERFIKSNSIDRLLDKHGKRLHILTVHSNSDLITYNGNKITREEFDKLRNDIGDDDTQMMIMMHYDILSEGIDVSGLTGVVILRNMNEAKFLQTVGRCVRVYRKNRALKPHGFVYFPDINDKDLRDNFFDMIHKSTEEGYIPSEFINEAIAAGVVEDEDVLEDFGPESDRVVRRSLDLYIAAVEDESVIEGDYF